ncbi:G8 domain-containing protein DDB_G0286311-like [Scyliorhinus canicula]|uniref:G8 domain-containing protein DDB_G0286311-like n=1 Tax=Scyliorhinus canicula TaxID=7830 RepID=UPI0018F7C6BA|nr:G8 domain-containing protein DDB_G0286311-like [Scyliorhinus canicula]
MAPTTTGRITSQPYFPRTSSTKATTIPSTLTTDESPVGGTLPTSTSTSTATTSRITSQPYFPRTSSTKVTTMPSTLTTDERSSWRHFASKEYFNFTLFK